MSSRSPTGTCWRSWPASPGRFGVIFRKAQNRIQDPAKLKRLIVDLIDRENWSAAGVDIKGDAYEELLAKGAEDIKSGAGQYFTPRALIAAMVDCIQPTPTTPWCDPACGTGGLPARRPRLRRPRCGGPDAGPAGRTSATGSSTAPNWSTALLDWPP